MQLEYFVGNGLVAMSQETALKYNCCYSKLRHFFSPEVQI